MKKQLKQQHAMKKKRNSADRMMKSVGKFEQSKSACGAFPLIIWRKVVACSKLFNISASLGDPCAFVAIVIHKEYCGDSPDSNIFLKSKS